LSVHCVYYHDGFEGDPNSFEVTQANNINFDKSNCHGAAVETEQYR